MSLDVLIVGAQWLRERVERILQNEESRLRLAASGQDLRNALTDDRPDLVILDFQAPGIKPLKTLAELYADRDSTSVMVVAEQPGTEEVVKCMQLGVIDVIDGWENNDRLRDSLTAFLANWRKRQQAGQSLLGHRDEFGPQSVIGDCPAMQRIVEIVRKVAKRKYVTVLIQGETGTGKEVVARAIHYATAQNTAESFVEINCSAIPEHLLEAELFGYEKGAFTDAKFRKKGLFEMAEGGTLFLDEIGDMSANLQAKLLKAIEEKKMRRLGGTSDILVNARIVSGTNVNLTEMIEAGSFRRDLFYRLNVVNLTLPPLRERGDDVVLLANFFLQKFMKDYELQNRRFTPAALAALREFDWPGNVRELQHVVERTVLLGENEVIDSDQIMNALGVKTRVPAKEHLEKFCQIIEIPRDGMSLKEGERQLIREVLSITKWNKTRASQILGISRPRLNRKIEEYRLDAVM